MKNEEKIKNIRLQAMIRPKTMKLLKDFCELEQLDISRAVDDLLYGRLAYLEKAKTKAEKQNKKQPNYKDESSENKDFVDNYWSDK